jgi:ribosome-binding factor A
MRRERNENEGAGHRHARLQGLLGEELRALLRDDVTDPALVDVRITAVVLSVDYRHARVHFALHGVSAEVAQERGRAELALGRATPFFRARLAEAIDLKRVPDLRFVFDGVAPPDDKGWPCSE